MTKAISKLKEQNTSILAKNIKKYRAKMNLSQQEVANKLSDMLEEQITASTISNWENAKHLPSILVIIELCKLLNIGILDIIEGIDVPIVSEQLNTNTPEADSFADFTDYDKLIINQQYTNAEQRLIEVYRSLDERGRKLINGVISIEDCLSHDM